MQETSEALPKESNISLCFLKYIILKIYKNMYFSKTNHHFFMVVLIVVESVGQWVESFLFWHFQLPSYCLMDMEPQVCHPFEHQVKLFCQPATA